jgi:hypothetical protein
VAFRRSVGVQLELIADAFELLLRIAVEQRVSALVYVLLSILLRVPSL